MVAACAAVIVENRVVTPKEEIETALYDLLRLSKTTTSREFSLSFRHGRRGRNEAKYYLERAELDRRVSSVPQVTVRTRLIPPRRSPNSAVLSAVTCGRKGMHFRT